MPEGPLKPRELGHYVSIAQVGMEMAAPIGLGVLADSYLGWKPWGTIAGAVLGLVGGIAHLIAMANQQEQGDSSKPENGAR